MPVEHYFFFPPFHLDLANERLGRGAQVIFLKPKTFAVLRYLVENPGRLVTKKEVRQAVWRETCVSEGVLRSYVQELREALGDDAKAPRFIETVHGRGYRFLAPITSTQPSHSLASSAQSLASKLPPNPQHSAPHIVGRETELAQLRSWLDKALSGERQVVFVTGEPGVGKTTLVETFLDAIRTRGDLWIARGQCIEHYGTGEAYLPVLDALGRLCREPGGEQIIELLAQDAPTWLVQMPWILNDGERKWLQGKHMGTTPQRMLREMAEALEAITAKRGLVLTLDDMQWSDYSTLDLSVFLAQRREPARLLVIGTYRSAEVLGTEHPLCALTQELQLHGRGTELRLRCLTEAAVLEYLAARFAEGAHEGVRELARLIHRRTEGNPLFMVNLLDDLKEQGVIKQTNGQWALQADIADLQVRAPEGIRQMIERQFARLSPGEQGMLEAGSVAGMEFSAAAVAAGLETEVGEVEEQCEELARRGQFLRAREAREWPDGTVAACYEFLHSLYQEVLYNRVPAGKRAYLHRRIGGREEQGYGSRSREVAATLAVHFEQGRDYHRAIQYARQAAENAIGRGGYREALDHARKGLALLTAVPATLERTQHEIVLQTHLGWALQATNGPATPEAEKAYTRALELCRQGGETAQLLSVLQGLRLFYQVRGEVQTARALAEQCLNLTQRGHDPALLRWAHAALGETLCLLGELGSAREHLEQDVALSNSPKEARIRVPSLSWLAFVLSALGYADQALRRSQEALTLAQEQSHPNFLAYALYFAAVLHMNRREWQAARERAEAAIALSTAQGFALWAAQSTIVRGGALAEQGQVEEGIAQMLQGLAMYAAIKAEAARPYYLVLLAKAYGKAEQAAEGLTVLADASAAVRRNGQQVFEPWLYCVKGELSLKARGPRPGLEAEDCFRQAIDIARRQNARLLELRAVMSLSWLWQQQGKKKKARQMLAEIYGWFTEGFDTADLQEAQVLLEELGNR